MDNPQPIDIEAERKKGTDVLTLEERLQEYYAAIRGEFEVAADTDDNGDISAEAYEDAMRKVFRANGANAAATIVWLSHYASSDGVRLAAAKTILGEGFKSLEEENDPMTKLLKKLTREANKAKVREAEEALIEGQ